MVGRSVLDRAFIRLSPASRIVADHGIEPYLPIEIPLRKSAISLPWLFSPVATGFSEPTFDLRSGAGKGARTLDLYLGKVSLYQLSYSRTEICVSEQRDTVNAASLPRERGGKLSMR